MRRPIPAESALKCRTSDPKRSCSCASQTSRTILTACRCSSQARGPRRPSKRERGPSRPRLHRDGNLDVGIGDVTEGARLGFARAGFEGIPIVSGLEFAAHAPVSHISAELKIQGQALTLGSACTTGLDAVQWATQQIADGYADVALAGATDAPFAELAYATLSALGILTTYEGPPSKASRPYAPESRWHGSWRRRRRSNSRGA